VRRVSPILFVLALGCSAGDPLLWPDGAVDVGAVDVGAVDAGDAGTPPVDAPVAMDAPATCGEGYVERLFAARCATGDCHARSVRRGGIDLESPGVLGRLSATRGNCDRTRLVVAPGDPARSLLMAKLDPAIACGEIMPPDGAPLGPAELACVRAWIAAATPAPVDAGADVALTACQRSDGDGDGFGTDPSCAMRDCDDANLSIHPGATEACNALDDNCDGRVDDGFAETTCGVGACQRTSPLCVAGRFVACAPGAPAAERCNGIDDDCDGSVDEDAPGVTCGVGRCQRSARCVAGALEACVPGAPMAEACNGMDDDCDGTVDEGLRAAVDGTSYPTLATLHAGCNGTTQRVGPECNAAIHRFCGGRAMGCMTSGFGPVENGPPAATVTCVRGEARRATYTQLMGQHPGCTGNTERIGMQCNAAIHRWCMAQGFATGFGPVENSGDDAHVTCLASAQAAVVGTTYTALARLHSGCTATTRIGPECNAAMHRFCASMGFASGFGPLENSGDTAVVGCVRP
jgi:hypothetical protein